MSRLLSHSLHTFDMSHFGRVSNDLHDKEGHQLRSYRGMLILRSHVFPEDRVVSYPYAIYAKALEFGPVA
ncbi:hypothetical protein GX51_08314 [Blastomyces parvus]|uniref:Uncharacterized protein n=1 Tax=Blastomyces parvus TaxID=2060905 RepID=A0A2B7W6P3_9EURO|nr:hypothetical protein GX51_08314 [Blastomyces parvus]